MNNSFYNDFAVHFAASTLPSLVRSFNSQVGNRGFNSVRAAHDRALIDELVRRGIDVSAVFDGTTLSFAHHVELDNNRLVIKNKITYQPIFQLMMPSALGITVWKIG